MMMMMIVRSFDTLDGDDESNNFDVGQMNVHNTDCCCCCCCCAREK